MKVKISLKRADEDVNASEEYEVEDEFDGTEDINEAYQIAYGLYEVDGWEVNHVECVSD